MQTKLLLFVPVVLLTGLLIGLWGLNNAAPRASTCMLGDCPLQISASRSGDTFSYDVGTRFSVYLDRDQNPRQHLSASCMPEGTIGVISNVPAVAPPYYVAGFEGVQSGTCTLKNDHFSATVVISDQTAGN